MKKISQVLACAALCGLAAAGVAQPVAATELTLWSHWADQQTKVDFVNEAVKRFEAKHPGDTVKVTWYQKNPLYSALKVALSAGNAPDIFYTEVNQTEYIDNGFIAPLDDLVNWNNVYDWARKAWTFNGKTYGFPLETQSVIIVSNADLLEKFGYPLPANRQLDQAQFMDLVKKARAAGITPISQGAGDRPYPGTYLTYSSLLHELGPDDYQRLLTGQLPYKDPRVVSTLKWIKDLIDAKAYPPSLATMKLGESHYYFHTKPGAVMFPIGSWYASRAFTTPDKGGEPVNFPRSVMRFPAMNDGACNNCETVAVGGSYSINAASTHIKLAADLLNEMDTPDMANLWLGTVLGETGVKGDPSTIKGNYASYFKALVDISNNSIAFVGLPFQITTGACSDALSQVMNVAFPSGLISVDDAVSQMDQACYKAQ